MSDFKVSELPDIDREQTDKGNCPWCLVKMIDGALLDEKHPHDQCPKCLDRFFV